MLNVRYDPWPLHCTYSDLTHTHPQSGPHLRSGLGLQLNLDADTYCSEEILSYTNYNNDIDIKNNMNDNNIIIIIWMLTCCSI